MLFYILQKGRPKHVSSREWAHWFEDHSNDTIIAKTQIGTVRVETVFRSFVMGDTLLANPRIWETTVKGGPFHDERKTCAGSLSDARKMHKEMVVRVEKDLNHEPHNN